MHLFYTSDIPGPVVHLDETESKHVVRVLRLTKGDSIQLVDGKGNLHEAKINKIYPRKCEVEIIKTQTDFGKRKHYLHMAVAPTKNIDRFEWFLEKATEIGIDQITPILCENSERKVIKNKRLQKIIIAAMKQSLKAYLPKLNPLTPVKDILSAGVDGKKYIAHCYKQTKRQFKDEVANSLSSLILIGPEGDFSESEIQTALQNNFIPVSLGNSRLRTETAAVVACHTVNLLNE